MSEVKRKEEECARNEREEEWANEKKRNETEEEWAKEIESKERNEWGEKKIEMKRSDRGVAQTTNVHKN